MRNGMTHNQGVKVVIHDSSKAPNIVTQGIPAGPGTATNIGITLEELHRLVNAPMGYKSSCTNTFGDKYGKKTKHDFMVIYFYILKLLIAFI